MSELNKAGEASDLVWSIREIGEVIGRTIPQTHYLLRNGMLPARQVGEKWVASRSKLIAYLSGEAA